MGEILPSFEKGFDPHITLLWQNVKFLDGKEAIMFIPYCKVKGFNGKIIDFCDEFHKITGHSFRAGIPTFISSYPDKGSISELKEWGNWHSNSYKAYEKDEREKRRKLFRKIIQNMYMCKTYNEKSYVCSQHAYSLSMRKNWFIVP